MKILVTAAWLFISLAAVCFAEATKCRVCDKAIEDRFYFLEDKARAAKFEVCTNCIKLETRCFACNLPVQADFTTLTDGRLLCSYCRKDAVTEIDEAKKICLAARDELDRILYRFLALPETNVTVAIVDRFALESLFKTPGYGKLCPSVFGATLSRKTNKQTYTHTISVLSDLNKARLESVAVHEFGHTWLNENLSAARRSTIAPDAVEAFCELLAHTLMEAKHEKLEIQALKENLYTRGQLTAFLAAEKQFGFNAIVDWMKYGEAEKLDADNSREVQSVRLPPAGTSIANPPPRQQIKPTPLPAKLKLTNISGPPNRRLAIINDRTFGVGDQANLRLATTNLAIRCLEIRTNSVLIQIEFPGVKQELFLSKD